MPPWCCPFGTNTFNLLFDIIRFFDNQIRLDLIEKNKRVLPNINSRISCNRSDILSSTISGGFSMIGISGDLRVTSKSCREIYSHLIDSYSLAFLNRQYVKGLPAIFNHTIKARPI